MAVLMATWMLMMRWENRHRHDVRGGGGGGSFFLFGTCLAGAVFLPKTSRLDVQLEFFSPFRFITVVFIMGEKRNVTGCVLECDKTAGNI
jgi:hypothetical protein